jgi:hypothetical protein
VVIASGTRQLTGGLFEYCDLGSVALKGFAANVAAWQVLGVDASESRFLISAASDAYVRQQLILDNAASTGDAIHLSRDKAGFLRGQ